jgi:hypothetical protein
MRLAWAEPSEGDGLMAERRITWDFEGGRLAAARELAPDHWECAVAGDSDAQGRNRSAIWFACELHGMAGRVVTIDLVGLHGEWNLRPSMAWGPETRPVVAPGPATVPAAERPWRRLAADEVSWDGTPGAERLRLRFTVPSPEARGAGGSGVATLAYIEPYTFADHRRFVAAVVARHPGVVRHRVLGRSPEGRPIDLLEIGDQAGSSGRAIWVIFRQHPWETYSSYAAEGLVERLLADRAARLAFRWQVAPMVNVDGCARGSTRHNTLGKDPNREWNQSEPTPEVACLRQAILDELGGRPAFFLDVHNNNQQTGDYMALTNLSFGATPEAGEACLERYEALVRQIASGLAQRSHFSGTVRAVARPAPWGSPGPLDTGRRAGKPFAFPCVLLEMRTGPLPTRGGAYGAIDDQRRLGAALVESIIGALERDR